MPIHFPRLSPANGRLAIRLQSLREWLLTAWPLVIIAGLGFWAAFQFVEPAPPRHVVISTGGEEGAYYAFAQRYKEIFARDGITLEILPSTGSPENLERLAQGQAQIAFTQGGVQPTASQTEAALLSLGSVFYEPVWVFVRGPLLPNRLPQLEGWRIGVGDEGTGVRALADQLLTANELQGYAQLLPMGGLHGAEELQQGRLDALFVIAAPEAPVVQVLLRSPGIRVMSFSQAEAYRRHFPFLSRLLLPAGGVDLVRNTPRRDTQLLAATANLVISPDLHPALVSLMLNAMKEVHGSSGFFQSRGEFPAYKDNTFPLADAAQRYYQSGPPLLQRYMPFWMAVLADRFLVLALPLFALLLPLLRVAPALYSWRIRSRICRCYGELKFLENDIKQHYDGARRDEYRARLDDIEKVADHLSIPLAFSDLFYILQEHINLVRQRLERREQQAEPPSLPSEPTP